MVDHTGKLVTVLAITFMFALANATSVTKKFAYSGPDGCTDDTCDCIQEISKENDAAGNINATVYTLMCKEYIPPRTSWIPNMFTDLFYVIQNTFTDLTCSIKDMLLQVTEGVKTDTWISSREVFGVVYYFFVKRILGQGRANEDDTITKDIEVE